MKTYQDYLASQNKTAFTQALINDWRNSKQVKHYFTSTKYAGQENPFINARRFYYLSTEEIAKCGKMETVETVRESQFRSNFKIANGMFGKIVKQKTQYLLGNGAQLSTPAGKLKKDDIVKLKKELGTQFDRKIQQAGYEASLGTAAWAYCYIDNNNFNFKIFNVTEFIPLRDEETNNIMVGVRFWDVKTDNKDITFFELYELDGMTRCRIDGSKVSEVKPKVAYKRNILRFANDSLVLGEENDTALPIIPFYNNSAKTPDLTPGLKNQLDLYDIISSDFGNNLTDANEVYWVLENYAGQSVGDFKKELDAFRAIRIRSNRDNPASATPHTIEVPYNARQICLELLRKQIYSDAMALDMDSIRGGSLTNVAILAAQSDLDQKVAEFEWGALDFIEGIIKLWKFYTGRADDITVNDFIRRTIANDSEKITNLNNSPYLSNKTKIEQNPYSADDEEERVAAESNYYSINDDDEEDDVHGRRGAQADGQAAEPA